ncbi:MAG: UDP-N-acetylmuramoyl-L-alanine--D-glutamate ligase [Pseudomonadota bacterium]|nr:UDP-N-acetylmuramoyl-L-alanine--D-glutamate ligase [Pseudomonadota bacterium]
MLDAVVIGLGASGFASACYLIEQGLKIAITDDRTNPPLLARFKSKYPEIQTCLGAYDHSLLSSTRRIIMSPGICPHTATMRKIRQEYGNIIYSDIDLFLEKCDKPIIAVTGSNGKSTVIKMVHDMLIEAGHTCAMIGNVGTPVLGFLEKNQASMPSWVVIEISSFQLFWTKNMRCDYGAVINIFPNHLDWHASFQEYCQTKLSLLNKAKKAFLAEELMYLIDNKPVKSGHSIEPIYYNSPEKTLFIDKNRQENFLPKHLKENAVAARTIATSIGVQAQSIKKALTEFQPWPFRCELQYQEFGFWYNDAKSSNLAAAQHALANISAKHKKKVIWLAGGVAKKESFSKIPEWVASTVDHAIFFGRDAHLFTDALKGICHISPVKNLKEAVYLAKSIVQSKEDVVVFSPAAASFDQFKNFQHRGQCFNELIEDVVYCN